MIEYQTQILSVWRVFRVKAECVWAGPISCSTPEIGYSELLDALFEKYIMIPKEHAGKIAAHLYTHTDEGAKILEAYPASYHHSPVPELGIGLAMCGMKFRQEWPQFQWETLETITRFGSGWTTTKHEWSIEQLATARKKKNKMPRGLDKKVWDMLGVLRK
jgi:hypothetical protein